MATYIDELAEIEKQGKTAMRLREGVPGAQAGADDLRVRLNGGNPAVGNALRAASPTDYSEVGRRLDNAHPKPTTGEVLRGQPATDYSEARRLAKPPQTIAEAAKAPRNVPINPTTTTMADASRPYIQQAAQPATNANVLRPGGSIEAQAWQDARKPAIAVAPAGPIAQQGMASVTPAATPAAPAATAPKASLVSRGSRLLGPGFAAAAEGMDVVKVAGNPKSTGGEVAQQALEGAGRVGASILGAKIGAAAGAVGGPIGAGIGATIGGVGGYFAGDESIKALRASLGLGPLSPAEKINAGGAPAVGPANPNVTDGPNGSTVLKTPDGAQLASRPTEPPQTIATTAAAQPPVAAQPTQRMGAPRTIAQAAQPASKPAAVPGQDGVVEIIRMGAPGGAERTYAMPGPSGAYSEVDAGYVDKGGSLEALGKAQVQAGLNAADPLAAKTASDIAVERVKNEGALAVAQTKVQATDETDTRGAGPVLGVPVPTVLPWANQSNQKDANKVKAQEMTRGSKEVEKDADAARKEFQTAEAAKRFLALNEKKDTGGFSDRFGPTRSLQSMGSVYAEMEAITARLAPGMREPGSGAVSDYDGKQFERATVGVDKPRETNKNIANGTIAKAQLAQDYADFRATYLEQNGTLQGADRYWKQYVNANPIFDPKAEEGSYALNANRKGWTEHFKPQKPAVRDFPGEGGAKVQGKLADDGFYYVPKPGGGYRKWTGE